MSKRNITIITIILLLFIGILIFLFGRKERAPGESGGFFEGLFPSPPSETVTRPPSQFPPQITEKDVATQIGSGAAAGLPQWSLIPLGNDPIASLVAFGTTTRYNKNIPENLGHLFERKKDALGYEERISNLLIQRIGNIAWSPDGQKTLISYFDEADSLRKFLIEYRGTSTPKTRFVEDNIDSVAFSPDGKSLGYILKDSESLDIYTATLDFKGPHKILDNNIPTFEISWPSKNFLALKSKSSYAINGFLYTLNAGGGLLNKIVEGLGLDALWNRDGTGFVFSQSNAGGRMLSLSYYNFGKKESGVLPFATIAEKCVFGKKDSMVLYCGIPASVPPGRYPDDWWQGKVSFRDSIIAYDLKNEKIIHFAPTVSDTTNLAIFSDDSYLFFIDKNTSRLWALKLVDDRIGNLPKVEE